MQYPSQIPCSSIHRVSASCMQEAILLALLLPGLLQVSSCQFTAQALAGQLLHAKLTRIHSLACSLSKGYAPHCHLHCSLHHCTGMPLGSCTLPCSHMHWESKALYLNTRIQLISWFKSKATRPMNLTTGQFRTLGQILPNPWYDGNVSGTL